MTPVDPTPIKVTPVRRAPPAIMPTAWPPPGGARHGRRRGRSLIAASVAAVLTLAIVGVVLVNGWLPSSAAPTDPTTASLVDRSAGPSAAPPDAASRTAAPAQTLAAPPPTLAAAPAVGVEDAGSTSAPERTRRPRPAAAAASDTASTDELPTPAIVEASDRGDTPVVRNGFTCGNDAAPIRDPYDRTWRVSKVSYSTQPGLERVVLHLQRIGEARPGRDTMAIAGRVPTSRIEDFPEDVRPEKQRRRLLRVDLAGVPSGPDMRGFRLTGLGHVGELSMLPGRNGKTALLAIDSDACYRVRVPGWGSQVDADARYTEVIIDVKSP
jgi:hypothetical protein